MTAKSSRLRILRDPAHVLNVAALAASVVALLVSVRSCQLSRDALEVSTATSRAVMEITDAVFLGPAVEGRLLELDLTLKNFGQAPASYVGVRVESDFFQVWNPRPVAGLGLAYGSTISRVAPGLERKLRARTAMNWQPTEPTPLTQLFLILSYRDTATGEDDSRVYCFQSAADLRPAISAETSHVPLAPCRNYQIGKPEPGKNPLFY